MKYITVEKVVKERVALYDEQDFERGKIALYHLIEKAIDRLSDMDKALSEITIDDMNRLRDFESDLYYEDEDGCVDGYINDIASAVFDLERVATNLIHQRNGMFKDYT